MELEPSDGGDETGGLERLRFSTFPKATEEGVWVGLVDQQGRTRVRSWPPLRKNIDGFVP